MSDKKYPYKYTIITRHGKTITDMMNDGIPLNAVSRSSAKRVLLYRYPRCVVISLETKTKKHYDSSVGQMGSSIFLS